MEDIYFCESINIAEGGYNIMKQLKITHVITSLDHPLLKKFNTLQI
jgi:hypothetical protein